MTEKEQKLLARELLSLSVFREVLDAPAMRAFVNYLCADGGTDEKARYLGEFVYSLAPFDCSFSNFLVRAVCENENPYVVGEAKGKTPSASLSANARAELALFSRLSALDPSSLFFAGDGYVPVFESTPTDFVSLFFERVGKIEKYGYGVFASATMFRVEDGKILPVDAPDEITLDDFVGYEDERQKVLDNTAALLSGRPAANVLLYGDAGTGKSSTVKAIANHFAPEGLRLIELRKNQLLELPLVMGRIKDNPLKFIIFIDDLSFNKNDDAFSMLKAALEGSASAVAENALIYATSNRRHIVKESFSDRENADDVHHNDTVAELMSLSDRFGLTVYFERPAKALYLDIVRRLAERAGVDMERAELERRAEVFALAKGSRSPRGAEQFIDSLL